MDGVVINEKCKNLACKIREIIDAKSSFADWPNNSNVRNQLIFQIEGKEQGVEVYYNCVVHSKGDEYAV